MTDNIARLLALAAIGGSGSSGALVPEVVDALPTAGEEGKLYLVPRQVTETKNVFDEYIWTNNDWEKIGTTDIDLSDYATKNYVDGLAGVLSNLITTDKTNLVSAINELASKSSFNHVTVDTYIEDLLDGWNLVDSNKKLKLSKSHPDSYFKDSVSYLCFKKRWNSGSISYLAITWNGLVYYDDTTQYKDNRDYEDNPSLIWGVVGNNFITFTPVESVKNKVTSLSSSSTNAQYPSAKAVYDAVSNYLAKNNTTAYTPSGDYNPATKKYVDDSELPVFEGTSGEWDNLTEAQKEEYYISLVEPMVDKIWYDTTNFRGYKFTFGAPIANPDFNNENNYFVFNFDDSYITISNLTNLGPIIKTDSHGQSQDAYVYVTSSTLNAVKEKWSNWYDWDNAEMDKWYHLDYTKQQGDPDLVVKMEGDFTIEAGFEYPQYTSINGMVNGQEWVPGWISEDPTVIYWDITPFLWMFKNIEEVELGGRE